jgi:regulator of sigma E protease
MISLLIFLLILGILIVVHEFGHFIVAKRVGVKVEKFSLGFGPQIFSKKKNQTQYCINAIPLGGYVKLAGDNLEEYKGRPDEYMSKTPGERARIIFCGSLLNYVLGFLCFWLIFWAGYPTLTNKIGGLIDGFGAKEAGIKVGDRITAVDGEKVSFWEDLQKTIQAEAPGSVVRLSVSRDNKDYKIDVRVKAKEVDDLLGEKRNVGLIGIMPADEILKVKHGFIQSFFLSIKQTKDLTSLTYKALWRIMSGKLSVRESVTGPLGIFYITSKAASLGIIAVLHLIAVLNVSLAIFNLLPLPVLDGGHLVLLAVEKIRGKSLSAKVERFITQLGLTVIISLALLITYNDFLKFGDKIFKWLAK